MKIEVHAAGRGARDLFRRALGGIEGAHGDVDDRVDRDAGSAGEAALDRHRLLGIARRPRRGSAGPMPTMPLVGSNSIQPAPGR